MKKLILFFLPILMSVSCYYPRGRHMMDWDHMYDGYGGVIMWIILLVLLGFVVYFLMSGKKFVKRDEEDTPLEILKKRYAKGDISKQEYEKMRKDLE